MCLALLLLLTSCNLLAQTPPERAIELAITQKLALTQKTLAEDLGILPPQNPAKEIEPNFKIDSITVQHRDKVTNLSQFSQPMLRQTVNEVYRVSGMFDATLTAGSIQRRQTDSPFEVLLGREATEEEQGENSVETWYFLRP